MTPLPTVIVLAAGAGRRFAGPGHKLAQQAGAGDGSPVLAQTLRHVVASGLPVVVVTTAELAPLAGQQVAARDVLVLPSDGPHSGGVGDAIAAGVSARTDATGWIILPADMPRVKGSTLRAVAHALQEHAVACAQYQGRRGLPVGFSAELYSELSVLSGDEGVRRVVARYPSEGVEVDDPGVLLDIDTVEDLAAWRAGSGTPPAAQSLPR